MGVLSLALLLVACGGGNPAGSELEPSDLTLEEVIARSVAARGGIESLRAIRSVEMAGTMESTGRLIIRDAPASAAIEAPDRYIRRFESEPGKETVDAVDGAVAWYLSPQTGVTEAAEMPATRSKRFRRRADLEGPLVDWQGKGHQVELLGKGVVDDRPMYVLKIEFADGESTTQYLDASTFLLYREYERTRSIVRSRWIEAELTYGHYLEAGGVQWPGQEDVRLAIANFAQTTRWQSVDVNVDLENQRFAMP